jgi:hypothetical protein
MDRVGPDLYVGTVEDAGDSELLGQAGVSSVVSLTFDGPDQGFPSGVDVFRSSMMDGPRCDRDSFESAVRETVSFLERGETVLVHCSRGASRSPSVAAAAVALHQSTGIDEAFQQVGESREAVDPHEALLRLAVEVYEDLRG